MLFRLTAVDKLVCSICAVGATTEGSSPVLVPPRLVKRTFYSTIGYNADHLYTKRSDPTVEDLPRSVKRACVILRRPQTFVDRACYLPNTMEV